MLSVVHNIAMMNIDRQFGIITGKKSKSTEKLSSGYKVNRAADDAAGLSVSEKMRRQIRGLQKGSENVQEGISLVQVADGALEEVTDMLQRINELSIKAYNGTNTLEDRKYIQAEINQLIGEIERIAETTTYNEIPLFKGNRKEMVKIEADKVYTQYYDIATEKDVPAWLKAGIDQKLEKHSYTGLTQDTSGKMFQGLAYDAKGHITSGKYYGPADEGKLYGVYEYGGAWTETLDDNPTAKISFSGLTQCDDLAELYRNMKDLLGCAVGVPCGTCSEEYYGIGYSGTVDGYHAEPQSYAKEYGERVEINAKLDLSEWKEFTNGQGEKVNCFDRIIDLINEQNKDKSLTEDKKKEQNKTLACEIAQKLCAKTYDMITNVTEYKNHFDRALTDGQYDIIVYDYRDQNRLDQVNASDALVNVSAWGTQKIPYSNLVPGTEVEIENPMFIVCSAHFGDWIAFDLPLLNAETLGIKEYDVSRQSEIVRWHFGKAYDAYVEAYQKYDIELDLWSNDFHYEEVSVPAWTEKRKKPKPSGPLIPKFKNGEHVGFEDNYEIIEYEVYHPAGTKKVRVPNRPKPEPPSEEEFGGQDENGVEYFTRIVNYEPDSNRIIGDALQYVMQCRSDLGATQNRLEHTYNNNKNKEENLTAAESRIRDTDIAEEMIQYSNLSIIQQAGQAMMSHAQQDRQYILSLLQ